MTESYSLMLQYSLMTTVLVVDQVLEKLKLKYLQMSWLCKQ